MCCTHLIINHSHNEGTARTRGHFLPCLQVSLCGSGGCETDYWRSGCQLAPWLSRTGPRKGRGSNRSPCQGRTQSPQSPLHHGRRTSRVLPQALDSTKKTLLHKITYRGWCALIRIGSSPHEATTEAVAGQIQRQVSFSPTLLKAPSLYHILCCQCPSAISCSTAV